MGDQWLDFVEMFNRAYDFGEKLSAPDNRPLADCDLPLVHTSHRIIICSPHPDDECLTGSLALRLQSPATPILNLAFTLGSAPSRKPERKQELARACRELGFDARLVKEPLGFTQLTQGMQGSPEWPKLVEIIRHHFDREEPDLIVIPQAQDDHPTHQTVHHLSMAGLLLHTKRKKRKVLVAETGFWHPLKAPNLLLGLSEQLVAQTIRALVCHKGEIRRNPYHLGQPARLLDNVRRLSEAAGFGKPGPACRFGEPYGLKMMDCGREMQKNGPLLTIGPEEPLDVQDLFAGPGW